MNWSKPSASTLFDGALACYVAAEGYLIAKWDHSLCRGWQLYKFRPKSRRQRWIAGAGIESLAWTDQRAQRWAEDEIWRMG